MEKKQRKFNKYKFRALPHLTCKKTKQNRIWDIYLLEENNFLEIKKEEKKIKIYILKGILCSK